MGNFFDITDYNNDSYQDKYYQNPSRVIRKPAQDDEFAAEKAQVAAMKKHDNQMFANKAADESMNILDLVGAINQGNGLETSRKEYGEKAPYVEPRSKSTDKVTMEDASRAEEAEPGFWDKVWEGRNKGDEDSVAAIKSAGSKVVDDTNNYFAGDDLSKATKSRRQFQALDMIDDIFGLDKNPEIDRLNLIAANLNYAGRAKAPNDPTFQQRKYEEEQAMARELASNKEDKYMDMMMDLYMKKADKNMDKLFADSKDTGIA